MSISSFGIQEENDFPEQVREMMPGAGELRGGYLYGSGKPGLGIDLDERVAAKYPLNDDFHTPPP
jgi:mannonate dehydratase